MLHKYKCVYGTHSHCKISVAIGTAIHFRPKELMRHAPCKAVRLMPRNLPNSAPTRSAELYNKNSQSSSTLPKHYARVAGFKLAAQPRLLNRTRARQAHNLQSTAVSGTQDTTEPADGASTASYAKQRRLEGQAKFATQRHQSPDRGELSSRVGRYLFRAALHLARCLRQAWVVTSKPPLWSSHSVITVECPRIEDTCKKA